ncbi:MAG: tRNA-specific 2-thiouridylase [Parcubacteria group bacterium Licking1014_1]|nr:MAG: tRNA-specific 2-thiouridylase [Parcubacteria group bacterium Licking1014_1]
MRSGYNPPISGKKIVVAMSGGVDSSVAAALLKKQGYNVMGVFMKFWKDGKSGQNRCCSTESEKMARLVARKLDIPFYIVNAEKEFKKKVVDYFLKEYKKGATPNPCVVCNKEIKFGLLIDKALKIGADFVATGHYARIEREIPNPKSPGCPQADSPEGCILNKSKIQNPKLKLLKGKDKNKDQSYFLWQLNQKQLKHILFPVGSYTKLQVRALAKKFKLPVAETPESQEVCFIPNTTNEFLKEYLSTRPGLVVDKTGKVLGEHQGLWLYTIGQRRGIEVSQGPYYVVRKDLKKNNLIVSKNEKDLFCKELIAKNVNWIMSQKLPLQAEIKIRYKSNLAKAKIIKARAQKIHPIKSPQGGVFAESEQFNRVKIIFQKPQKAITPGQSVVFYNKEYLLGGGTIDKNL